MPTVIDARTRKTELYRDNRAAFMSMVRGDIFAFIEDCKRYGVKARDPIKCVKRY
jgi:hypothetical protein